MCEFSFSPCARIFGFLQNIKHRKVGTGTPKLVLEQLCNRTVKEYKLRRSAEQTEYDKKLSAMVGMASNRDQVDG